MFSFLFVIYTKVLHLGFASPTARDVPPDGMEFQVIYDDDGEPTFLYYPELDKTFPIGFL